MTGSDLIVLAPWVVFALGLAVIWLLLLRSRHTSGPRPPRPSRANPQEARCPEKNAEARQK